VADKIPSYSDAELLELLDNIESDRVERKRSFKNDAEKARQAVCAFANDLPNHNQPGILFIGAEDNGSPSNITVDDELLRNLSDIRDNGNILPMPVMNVEKRVLKGSKMAVVTVMAHSRMMQRRPGKPYAHLPMIFQTTINLGFCS